MRMIEREFKFMLHGCAAETIAAACAQEGSQEYTDLEQWYTPGGLRIRRETPPTGEPTWYLTMKRALPARDGQAVNEETEVVVPDVVARAVVADAVPGGLESPHVTKRRHLATTSFGYVVSFDVYPKGLFYHDGNIVVAECEVDSEELETEKHVIEFLGKFGWDVRPIPKDSVFFSNKKLGAMLVKMAS